MLPAYFLERIRKQPYIDAEAFVHSINQTPITSVRLHPLKKGELDLCLDQEIPWSTNGFFLKERPVFTLDPHFHAGAYYVQDASSQFLEKVLDHLKPHLPENPIILDLCAAPGGKSTHILSWMKHNGILVTNEVIQSRVKILQENIVKWGYENVIVTHSDPKTFAQVPEFFDVIVVDAPCSGEGLFRKDVNAIKEWSEKNCDLCASRQKRIVSDAIKALKPGGFLIYSTCTFNPAENEDNADFFVNQLGVRNISIPYEHFSGVTAVISKEGQEGYAFFPHKGQGEGFYIVCFQKEGEKENVVIGQKKQLKSTKELIPAQFFQYITKDRELDIITFLGNYFIFPKKEVQVFEFIKDRLKIYSVGVEIGALKGKDFVPSHAFLQSLVLERRAFPMVSLTKKEDALYYLRKDDYPIEGVFDNGWHVVDYQGSLLGGIKKIDKRWNNYYPKELKINMQISSK